MCSHESQIFSRNLELQIIDVKQAFCYFVKILFRIYINKKKPFCKENIFCDFKYISLLNVFFVWLNWHSVSVFRKKNFQYNIVKCQFSLSRPKHKIHQKKAKSIKSFFHRNKMREKVNQWWKFPDKKQS